MYAGKKLRQLRLQLDINQSEMASQLGLSQSYYAAIETSKRPITNKIIEKIKNKWAISEGYFSEKSSDIKGVNMRGYNEGVGEGVGRISAKKGLSKEDEFKMLRDALTLYSAYSTEASQRLPENLKHLNALLSVIYIHIRHISEDLLTSKIRKAIDIEQDLDTFFDEEIHLPPFDEYIKNKQELLNSLLPFLPFFEDIQKELAKFREVLDKIQYNLPPSAQIKTVINEDAET